MTLTYIQQYVDLLDAPHILVAGATGSGKSVFLRGLLQTITALRGPDDATLVLIDPKRVELSVWRQTRHCVAYATEPSDVARLLDRVIKLMEQRYSALQKAGRVEWTGGHVYVVVDELADLLTTDPRAISPRLQRILQLGRAAHICCILATQAPSRRILRAELTLNITHKLALRCDSSIESRQVIGTAGAELLPLHGKGILRSPGRLEYLPIEYVSPEEIAQHCALI